MRGLAVAPLVLAMSSNCFADQKLCTSVQQTPNTGLFGLYYHTHASPAWASADNIYSGAGALSLTRGDVDFALERFPLSLKHSLSFGSSWCIHWVRRRQARWRCGSTGDRQNARRPFATEPSAWRRVARSD